MPQPDIRRILSLIWFPFFFAGAFALMLLASFPAPEPHDIRVDVVGTTSQAHQVSQELERVRAGGFVVDRVSAMPEARADVASGSSAAAFSPTRHSEIVVADGASGSRANYLIAVFDTLSVTRHAAVPTRVDVAPLEPGDPNGVGLMFIGFPLLLVGLITSIVLVQFGGWALRWKVTTIALTGAFATVFTYFVGTAMSIIPNDEWLLLYGFLLTQAIGWITTGAAYFARQFFIPVAMTFVLVLGVPSAGATVNGDMLPGFVRWLNSFMPFAQFVDAARASSYLGGSGLARPVVVLCAWALGGAALLAAAALVTRRRVNALHRQEAAEEASVDPVTPAPAPTGRLHGTIRTTSGVAVRGARITAVDQHGNELARADSDAEGRYVLDRLGFGLYHLFVVALHCEPAIVPAALHPSHPSARRDIVLIDWSDASGNLTVGGAHMLSRSDG
jgi:hypothetical protein